MPFSLEKIQRWMQSVITHPDGIAPGIDASESRQEIDVSSSEIEQVISRSKALGSIERMAVYGNAYFARLLECMRESFPTMVHALGEETFDEFAFGYLQAYPSTSYTLGDLGDHFMQHLQETRPDREASDRGEVDWPDFLIDLAMLEWTIEKVFDGPGVENEQLLDEKQLHAISPDIWSEMHLHTVPCLRLLKFRFPVNAYFTAVRQEEEPELPAPQDEYVAITRREYIVRRFDLGRPQYELLSALMSGNKVEDSIALSAEVFEGSPEEFAAVLGRWFRDWSSQGFFQSLRAE